MCHQHKIHFPHVSMMCEKLYPGTVENYIIPHIKGLARNVYQGKQIKRRMHEEAVFLQKNAEKLGIQLRNNSNLQRNNTVTTSTTPYLNPDGTPHDSVLKLRTSMNIFFSCAFFSPKPWGYYNDNFRFKNFEAFFFR